MADAAKEAPQLDPGASPAPQAIDAWNFMGGLEWEALPLAVEFYDVNDVEQLIRDLTVIRGHVEGRK